MGNCIRHESAMHWGGDDWSSMAALAEEPAGGEGKSVDSRRAPQAEVVIKVRITKRQLEELLGRAHVEELPVPASKLLLLAAAAGSVHRPWRPALQSIPEAD